MGREQRGVPPRAPGSRHRDHECQDGTVRAAAVMHVTSMRPSRDKFGMGLASRRGSPTSFSTAAIHLVIFFHLSHSSNLLLWIFSHPPLGCSSYSSACLSSSSLQTYRILDVCGLFVLHKYTCHVFFLFIIYYIIQDLLWNATANLSQCSFQREQKYSFPAESLTSAPTSHNAASTSRRTDSVGQWEETSRRVSGAGGPRSTGTNVFASEEAKQVSHADS